MTQARLYATEEVADLGLVPHDQAAAPHANRIWEASRRKRHVDVRDAVPTLQAREFADHRIEPLGLVKLSVPQRIQESTFDQGVIGINGLLATHTLIATGQ